MTFPVNVPSRRDLLRSVSAGFGSLAFASLAASSLPGIAAGALPAEQPLAPKPTHFPPRARRVIFLCMQGGPSHVDTFDYKPKLISDAGRSMCWKCPPDGAAVGFQTARPEWPVDF